MTSACEGLPHTGQLQPAAEQTLLLVDGDDRNGNVFEVAPMKYAHVPRGADMLQRAFVNDPVMVYYGSVDTAPFFHTRWKIRHNLTLLDAVHQERVLTINGGESLLEYGAPGNNEPSRAYNFFFSLLEKFNTPELAKRKAEFRGKIKQMVQRAFGDKVDDMYDIQILGTAPEAQNRGYASALVNTLSEMADTAERDVWVVTAAHGFYARLGFVTVAQDSMGGDNPNWDGKPIEVHVMCRKHGSSSTSTDVDMTGSA
ncbi:hypothetical protein GY45DRAFT_811022 [Cubamyces sp. BRFM 1775]|nr:hypothetical protein GY45DRAFT_811022 [Cubamyces sp. BRFM 1775]